MKHTQRRELEQLIEEAMGPEPRLPARGHGDPGLDWRLKRDDIVDRVEKLFSEGP